jgi:hypothetical protein
MKFQINFHLVLKLRVRGALFSLPLYVFYFRMNIVVNALTYEPECVSEVTGYGLKTTRGKVKLSLRLINETLCHEGISGDWL